MIKLTAQIKLSEEGGALESAAINTGPNNIGAGIDSVLNTEKTAINPFIIGVSTVGDGSTYESHLDYYMGSVIADESGLFSSEYEITVEGAGVENFTIVFDQINGGYPISATADGNVYSYSGDCKYTFDGLNGDLEAHTVVISNWSIPYAPMVITGIYAELNLDFDYNRISNLEAQHKDRADIDKPSFGIFSNSGSLHLVDADGSIKRYAEKRMLKSGLKLTITLHDTLSGKKQVVGVYNTEDWDYDYLSNEADCSLKEKLDELQDVLFDGLDLDSINKRTGKDIYEILYDATPAKFNFVAYDKLNDMTRSRLSNIEISKSYLESGNLWAQWDKLCVLCRGHISQKFNGEVVLEV